MFDVIVVIVLLFPGKSWNLRKEFPGLESHGK